MPGSRFPAVAIGELFWAKGNKQRCLFPFLGLDGDDVRRASQHARFVVLAGAGATLVQQFDHLDGIEGGRFALGDPLT